MSGGFMFEQLPAWDHKITLSGAILNAIGWGFVAGMSIGVSLEAFVLLRTPSLYQLEFVAYFVVALALAIRFYFLAMSRAHETKEPTAEMSRLHPGSHFES
jgi:hypothetical protein